MLKDSTNKEIIIRVGIIAFLFILQIIWFTIVLTRLTQYSMWLNGLLFIFSIFMILFLIRKNESPTYRFSWIMVIALFPLFGGLLYLLIGNKRPAQGMKRSLEDQQESYKNVMDSAPDAGELLLERDSRLGLTAKYLRDYDRMPVYTNTGVDYYPNGESMMDDLLEDLRAAERFIFIEFFIVEYGEMFDAIFEILKQKADQGVDVRFMYDDFGTITRLPKSFDEELEKLGIRALKFNPVKPLLSVAYNTRDHRKFIIIDGKIGYTGGLNLADEYINKVERFGYWKDNMIRIKGPAVWNLTVLFLNMWNAFYVLDESYEGFVDEQLIFETEQMMQEPDQVAAAGFVQPFGDSPLDSEALGENIYLEMINYAEDYVYIYTPYLVISDELESALALAAKRGVDVRIMTPGIPDKKIVYRVTRSYYPPLLKAGVRIFEYSPGFLHAKTFVVDDCLASVGTINLDYRSLYLHFEASTILYYHPVISEIKEDFLKSQSQSREVSLKDTKQTLLGEVWDSVLRLMAPFI
ncbi:cardiolipin synthase [Hutsoniella sourekii]|uniref:cardiolipin synthase n=1 Tax=Hutsoniella sourekii TaxID=87650 RepID=UPI000481A569|nr:cardiolipin synthase [Hutsoniella sourekii]